MAMVCSNCGRNPRTRSGFCTECMKIREAVHTNKKGKR